MIECDMTWKRSSDAAGSTTAGKPCPGVVCDERWKDWGSELTAREQSLGAQAIVIVVRDVLVQEMGNVGGHLESMFVSRLRISAHRARVLVTAS